MQRQPEITEGWDAPLLSGAIGSCEPQRAEFRRSARNTDEFDQMNRMFAELYPDVPVPKSVWRWIDAAQHRLAGAGAARALSVVDLLVCGTAAITGLVIPPRRRRLRPRRLPPHGYPDAQGRAVHRLAR